MLRMELGRPFESVLSDKHNPKKVEWLLIPADSPKKWLMCAIQKSCLWNDDVGSGDRDLDRDRESSTSWINPSLVQASQGHIVPLEKT